MKKGFFILILILTINVTAPAGNSLYMKHRHSIEYTKEAYNKKVNNDELLKNKVFFCLSCAVLAKRIIQADSSFSIYDNSS